MRKIDLSLVIALLLFSTSAFSQEYSLGLKEGIDSGYLEIDKKVLLSRGFYDDLPSSFSLKKYSPIPSNQGVYETCAGWAVAYAARTISEALRLNWTSKQQITESAFSPTFQYRAGSEDVNCNGAYLSVVMKSLSEVGSLPSKEFVLADQNYLCPSVPLPISSVSKAGDYKIEDYAKLWDLMDENNNSKIEKIKTSISKGHPVIIGMHCPPSFKSVDSTGVWSPPPNELDDVDFSEEGHALCVVGYDDDKYGGAFEVQNSWGTTKWGDGGYCWMRYDDFASIVFQAYEIFRIPEPAPKEPLFAGSIRLYDLDDRENLEVRLTEKTRNWSVVGPNNGATSSYKVIPDLKSGSEMRMYVTSDVPAYVYLLGTGAIDTSVISLFPVEGISPALNYFDSEIALPSEDHYFKMDNTIGENYIVVLFSKTILDIEKVKKQLTSSSGSLSSNLHKALADNLINSEVINFARDEIQFEVGQSKTNKETFAMILQFRQVD